MSVDLLFPFKSRLLVAPFYYTLPNFQFVFRALNATVYSNFDSCLVYQKRNSSHPGQCGLIHTCEDFGVRAPWTDALVHNLMCKSYKMM
jgi:hypothetical protein